MSLEVTGLSKSFGGITILRRVSMSVERGSIHALLGANGAGKSTLIKSVSGALVPDGGTIILEGREITGCTPHQALEAGISVVYQNLSLIPTLTVSENFFLGREKTFCGLLQARRQTAEAWTLLRRLDIPATPSDLVGTLPPAVSKMVEIAKAVMRNSRLLILDEPTAALANADTSRLFDILLQLRSQGMPILYVTHRLGEVSRLTDTVTVLRNGEIAASGHTSSMSRERMIEAIVGQTDLSRAAVVHAGNVPPKNITNEPALRITSLSADRIGPLSLEVQSGEIVGIYGLTGSGRSELLETIGGARRWSEGRLEIRGSEQHFRSPAEAILEGVCLVPSDRLRKSIFLPLSSKDNIVLPRMAKWTRKGLRAFVREREFFDDATESLRIMPADPELSARRMSGGNQQNLILARWVVANEKLRVLLVDEPTEGVDVGARGDLDRLIRQLSRKYGIGVLWSTSDTEELARVADRVLVMAHGKIVGEVAGSDLNEANLVSLSNLQ